VAAASTRSIALLLERLDGSVAGLFHRLEAHPETRGRTVPIQSHRRSEVAASRTWLDSLPRLPQVDVLITTFNEEGE
jgi:hypothetical protein